MRYILIILVFISVGANAQMVIKAHANYRPYAQPAANLLLDDYPNAAAAYSLRKLDKDYTGAAIRVRKDTTGQPEQDIGFTASGDLDTVGLKNFLLTRSGFVTTWYDQSGNGRNATQSTQANQPRIANLGVIDRKNGKPMMDFDGSNDHIQVASSTATFKFLHDGTSNFIAAVSHIDADLGCCQALIETTNGSSANVGAEILHTSSFIFGELVVRGVLNTYAVENVSGTNAVSTNQFLLTMNRDADNATAANRSEIFINNGAAIKNNTRTSSASAANATGNLTFGATSNGSFYRLNGGIQEILIYSSDQSSNRTGIRDNINTHYGIY
jgi:hypothetical protein